MTEQKINAHMTDPNGYKQLTIFIAKKFRSKFNYVALHGGSKKSNSNLVEIQKYITDNYIIEEGISVKNIIRDAYVIYVDYYMN